jgi:hypothetical protein
MELDLRMKGDKIPDQHHIARFCRPMQVPDGQIQATAFMLRKDEECLSVNWLEFLNRSSRESEIAELRKIYSAKFNVGARAKIAVLNVGEVREKVLTEIQIDEISKSSMTPNTKKYMTHPTAEYTT